MPFPDQWIITLRRGALARPILRVQNDGVQCIHGKGVRCLGAKQGLDETSHLLGHKLCELRSHDQQSLDREGNHDRSRGKTE